MTRIADLLVEPKLTDTGAGTRACLLGQRSQQTRPREFLSAIGGRLMWQHWKAAACEGTPIARSFEESIDVIREIR